MNEMMSVVRDIRSGALPAEEIPGFVRFLLFGMCRLLGAISLGVVFGFVVAWAMSGGRCWSVKPT